MKTVFIIFVVIGILFPMAAHAEYYQYLGSDGAVHFTDNQADVPQDQQANVKSFKGITTTIPSGEELQQPDNPSGSADNPPSASSTPKTFGGELSAKAQALEQEKEALSEIYNQLEADKKDLGPKPGPGASLNEIQLYMDKVASINQRISAYASRRDDFQKDVDEFNAAAKALH